jgi:hypothetical protein
MVDSTTEYIRPKRSKKPPKTLRCKACGAAIIIKSGERTIFKGYTEYHNKEKYFVVTCKCGAMNLSRPGRKGDTVLIH